MVIKKLSCDTEEIFIGDDKWTLAIPNYYDNKITEMRIYESDKEATRDYWGKYLHFIFSIQGKCGILDGSYNCCELSEKNTTLDDARYILDGCYYVYRSKHEIVFVKQ